MKKNLVLIVLAFCCCQMAACSGENGDVELNTADEKFSYVMGYEAVGTLNGLETVTIDEAAFIKGIRDAFHNELPLLTQQQGLDVKAIIFEKERVARNQQIMKDADKNLAEQKDFLEENKSREGMTTTASGLQYQILEKGDGPLPGVDDYARINARARLLDGSLVKSLSTSDLPTFVPVKGRLPFWEEALPLMPTGSRFRFFLPSALAFGETGDFIDGGCVGPNHLIVIDIELLEVKKPTDF
jgi:FKBP-type peptidyl-prolyl cis-trans isomerase